MYKLFILAFIVFALSQTGPLVGDFDQLNGVATLGITTWDGKTHTPASQDFPATITGVVKTAFNSKGDLFYSKVSGGQSWIEYQNTTIRTRVGGRNGYLAGAILGMLATKTKLYVCGTFTQAGSLFVNQTGVSGQIVEMDISNGVSITSTFTRILTIFDTTKTPSGFNCASTVMWNLNDVLIAREAYANSPLLNYQSSTAPAAISGTTTNFTQLHITNFGNATNYLYALGSNMQTNGGQLPYIQKYSGSGTAWTALFPSTTVEDGNALSVVIRQFIVAPNDVVYLTFSSGVLGDVKENRNRYIYEYSAGTIKKVTPNARFSDGLVGFANVLNSDVFNLQWDPMLNTLMVWGSTINGVIYGNEFQAADDTIVNWYDGTTQTYGKKIAQYAYLFNQTQWLQSFGGGVTPILPLVAGPTFLNGKAILGATYGWNHHASKVAVWNSATSQYESFFAKGKGIDANPSSTMAIQVNVFDDDFSQANGGILAGSFRTIDNVTCNSICMVSATGNPTPLAQANGTFADVGVRTFADTPGAFEYSSGNVYALAHLASSKYTYVGGNFRLAGNVAVSNIARYNWVAKTWHDLAGGVDGNVNAFLRDNENLYVGGSFSNVGSMRVNNVAVWNTITEKWSALNFGLDASVTKLFWYSGKVTAIGTFGSGSGSNTKGNLLKQIAQWDGKRWRGLVGGYAKSFTDADTCSTNNLCSIDLATPAAGNIKDASVINGVLWIVTSQSSKNLYSYDGIWARYDTPPSGFGGAANAIILGQDAKPLIQMTNPSLAEWRIYDQGLDNYILPRYLTPGSIAMRSFGTVAHLNILLLAFATLLVFIQ